MIRKKVNRRSFLRTSSAGITGLVLLPHLGRAAAADSNAGSLRRVYPLNRRWLYSDKITPNGTKAEFNDNGFLRVTIPHTNKMLAWHGFDDKEFEFVSLYRRHFRLPVELLGRRVFIDFGGVMTAATVTINGQRLGEYRGDYVLAVEVDSTERKDIPPFGGEIDYLTFGGIYRDVALRFVPETFIENVFARAFDVLKNDHRVDVRCYLDSKNPSTAKRRLTVELRDGQRVVATQSRDVSMGAAHYDLTLNNLGAIQLWNLQSPKLYQVRVLLLEGDRVVDDYETRIGFRESV